MSLVISKFVFNKGVLETITTGSLFQMFGTYQLLTTEPLTVKVAFTSLSVIMLMSNYIFIIPFKLPSILTGYVSTRRLQQFLMVPRECSRGVENEAFDDDDNDEGSTQEEFTEYDKTISKIDDNISWRVSG